MTAVTPTAVPPLTGRAACSPASSSTSTSSARFGAEIRGVDVASASDDQVR